MQSHLKATVILMVIAPALTEIVSGNTPPHALLHPQIAGFLVAAYGLPLLLIRETAIRWRLRTGGLFLLGLAYGFLNEGLLAQTLIRYEHVPVANFDHYVCAAGINFSWMALIVPWHALMAVCLPLALLASWFPSCADSPWLGGKAFSVLAMIVGGCVVFLGVARTPRFQMRAFLLAILVLTACAWFRRGSRLLEKRHATRRTVAFAFGSFFYLALFLGGVVLAAWKAPAGVYFAYIAAVILGAWWIASRYGFERSPNAAMVATGAYFVASLFNGFAGVKRHSLEAALCGAILAAAFFALWRYWQPEARPATAR